MSRDQRLLRRQGRVLTALRRYPDGLYAADIAAITARWWGPGIDGWITAGVLHDLERLEYQGLVESVWVKTRTPPVYGRSRWRLREEVAHD
jgi:hypothetical protein